MITVKHMSLLQILTEQLNAFLYKNNCKALLTSIKIDWFFVQR